MLWIDFFAPYLTVQFPQVLFRTAWTAGLGSISQPFSRVVEYEGTIGEGMPGKCSELPEINRAAYDGDRRDVLHIWPFDGWSPPSEKSRLSEVYPAILYQRYKQSDPNFPRDWPRDAQDAFVIAAWLRERDRNGTLDRYFQVVTLTEREKEMALQKEGWILGVC